MEIRMMSNLPVNDCGTRVRQASGVHGTNTTQFVGVNNGFCYYKSVI